MTIKVIRRENECPPTRPACAASVLLAVSLLAVAGCSIGGTQVVVSQPGPTALERVLNQVGDDGKIAPQVALQAFGLAFSPPPGVHMPPGGTEQIESGTGPLRWVYADFAQLSPAQQDAVRAVTPVPTSGLVSRPDGLVLMAAAPGQQQHYKQLIQEASAYYAGKLGGPLKMPVKVKLNTRNLYQAHAYTFAVDAKRGLTGPVAECDIYVNPVLQNDTAAAQREAMFHEVFHCYQSQMLPNLAQVYALPAWLVEGGALYAGDEGAGAAPIAAKWWRRYFATPTSTLFKRTYDATGFFSHLVESGGSFYGAFAAAEQACAASGNAAAFNAFAATVADRLFETWPSGLLRQPALGTDWDTSGPGITANKVVPGAVAVAGGSAPSGQILAYANDDRKLAVSAEVVVVNTGQYGHLKAESGSFDTTSPTDLYCTLPTPCTCPQGSPGEAAKFKQLPSGSYYLALGGGPAGNTWSIAAFSMAAFCQKPPDQCIVGSWRLTTAPAPPTTSVSISSLTLNADITAAGLITFTLDIEGASSLAPVTVSIKGPYRIQVLAVNGIMQPRSADFSGVTVNASYGGIPFPSASIDQLFPGLEQTITPIAYRCAQGTLTLTSVTGRQWIFSRA